MACRAAAIAPDDERSLAELRLVALHEAGHAVVGRALGLRVPSVSIVGKDDAGGQTSIEGLGGALPRSDIERRVTAILAGRAADEAFSSGPNSGASMDLRQATEILLSIHGVLGLGDRLTSLGLEPSVVQTLTLDHRLRVLVEDDLQRLMADARRLVAWHETAIRALADLLLRQRAASGAEIDQVMATTCAASTHAPGAVEPAKVREPAGDLNASKAGTP